MDAATKRYVFNLKDYRKQPFAVLNLVHLLLYRIMKNIREMRLKTMFLCCQK
jgi:hypothetical protein